MLKNKAALLKKPKKLKFPYLGNQTRYGPEIFSKLVSPLKVLMGQVGPKSKQIGHSGTGTELNEVGSATPRNSKQFVVLARAICGILTISTILYLYCTFSVQVTSVHKCTEETVLK